MDRFVFGCVRGNPTDRSLYQNGAYAFFKNTLPYSPGFDDVGVVGKVGVSVQCSKPGDSFL